MKKIIKAGKEQQMWQNCRFLFENN